MYADEIRDLAGTILGSLPGAFFILAAFGLIPTVIYEVGIISGFLAGRLVPRWLWYVKGVQIPRVRLEWA